MVMAAGIAAFAYHHPEQWRSLLVEEMAVSKRSDAPRIEFDMVASGIYLTDDGRYVVHGILVNAGNTPGWTTDLTLVFRRGEDVLAEST